ncbi:MAG: diacylglycerol kinase family lipid kinase [Actinomycetota bacterium]|nr:diacylglycerol kinase family lipid kinase [Actinomycetota bacterium]
MKTVLVISNAHAGSVSQRTKEVIVKALQADFKLEVCDTHARSHATELARDAADRGFDAVIAFGGDGTINETAQGLIGTDVAFGLIPGGSTNVLARSLGVPRDPVEATAFVASHIASTTSRMINVGRMNERYFLFSAGVGLDAEVVKRVEADPEAKRRRREWFFLSNALKAGVTHYRGSDAWIEITAAGGSPERVVLAVCCNGRPFTFFKKHPVDVCPHARLDRGLDLFGLRRMRGATIPRLAWALLVSRSHVRWRQSVYLHDVDDATLRCDRPLPVQVDGDYVGERDEVSLSLVPRALRVLV